MNDYLDYLEHHGILGQKWGVRRFQNEDGSLTSEGRIRYANYKADKKTARQIKRRVAASVRNMKVKGKYADENNFKYQQAEKDYQKELKKPHISNKKRAQAQQLALDKIDRVGDEKAKTDKELNIARDIYARNAHTYAKLTNKMIKDYGSENIKSLSAKTIDLGQKFINEMHVVKTGITVANIPLIGNVYVSKVIGQEESNVRRKRMKEDVSKKY